MPISKNRPFMKEAGTIEFKHAETSDLAVVIVRYDQSHVALCVSLESDGDVEILMRKEDCRKLLEALNRAVE
jgi:hypothetical protein